MIARYIPTPTISQFSVGPIVIHAYAICIIVGAAFAIWLTNRRFILQGGSNNTINDLAIWVIPGGVIGARLYHVVTSPKYFEDGNYSDIFKIWEGGLGIWGAIAGGVIVGIWRYKDPLPITKLLDAVAPGLLIAQGFGRFGNWFNGELYGRQTDLPWALKLHDGLTYHPTFLYEAICNFLLALILIKLNGRMKTGNLFYLYIFGYCFYRFFIEGIRIDQSIVFANLRLNQWVSLVIGSTALTKIFINHYK